MSDVLEDNPKHLSTAVLFSSCERAKLPPEEVSVKSIEYNE